MSSFDDVIDTNKRPGFPPAPITDSFNDSTRPEANQFPVGSKIWNTDDNALNWSDGEKWIDSYGFIT